MKLPALTALLFAAFISHAHAYSPSELVGTWKCEMSVDEDNVTAKLSTVETYSADGTFKGSYESEFRIDNEVLMVDYMTVSENWKLVGDKVYYSNSKVLDYSTLDGETGQFITEGDYVENMKKIAQDNADEDRASPTTIKFIDKNTYHTIVDDETGEFAVCRRAS